MSKMLLAFMFCFQVELGDIIHGAKKKRERWRRRKE